MSYPRRRLHLPDPTGYCRCGQTMEQVWWSNSGTTVISQACPTIKTVIGRSGQHPAHRGTPVGHQWIVVSKPEHDPACCSIRHIETAGSTPDPYWPGRHPGAPLDHTARRAVHEVTAGHITQGEALMRVALTAGINGDHALATVQAAMAAALDWASLPDVEDHDCPTPHRTPGQTARCATAGVVKGIGEWAVVNECFPWRKVRVAMHPTAQKATAALLRINDRGCGNYCRGDHHLARYARATPAIPAQRTHTNPIALDYPETHTVATQTHPDTAIGSPCIECATRMACSHRGLCWDCLTTGADQ